MKNITLLLLATVLGISSFAKGKNNPIDLTGSWKESQRKSLLKVPIDYTDTTYYDFLIGNEYTVHKANAFSYRGTYKVTSGQLDLGMRLYNIVEMTRDKIVLKDDANFYEFTRYEKPDLTKEDNAAANNSERAFKENVGQGAVRADQLAGHWEVYKRTSSEKLPEIDYSTLIRVIDVKINDGKISGTVASAQDMQGAPSWNIIRYENGIIYCSGKSDRQLKVLQCKDNDLIITEGITTYFFKQFK